ncbi:MAG TPA: zinc finger Ran-binding domain-containing protein [Pyrinomonadaceae bacterium]|jgi:hypothetical protein|nr:zinc finger Ran-binding domain-containing protein [Pyrinomonadaceae bacterium]
MKSLRCKECGLVNFASAEQCKRCGASLTEEVPADVVIDEAEAPKKRSFVRRITWILGMTCVILAIYYMSLLVTSDGIRWQQRQTVERAIAVLEQKGFSREVFVLRHLVSFRTTDNWWNTQVGHHDAYAATNFPFEVLTLYPEFFDTARDDTERATILLHESYHLFGANEAKALEGVWRNKSRLGWTADKYGETKVWKNTKELTMSLVPQLFRCGLEGKDDCIP